VSSIRLLLELPATHYALHSTIPSWHSNRRLLPHLPMLHPHKTSCPIHCSSSPFAFHSYKLLSWDMFTFILSSNKFFERSSNLVQRYSMMLVQLVERQQIIQVTCAMALCGLSPAPFTLSHTAYVIFRLSFFLLTFEARNFSSNKVEHFESFADLTECDTICANRDGQANLFRSVSLHQNQSASSQMSHSPLPFLFISVSPSFSLTCHIGFIIIHTLCLPSAGILRSAFQFLLQ
jgi:hypothetical protein